MDFFLSVWPLACVFSKSSTSESREIYLGVTQGSVLGPLLFCLYVNDLQQYFNCEGIFRIVYMDDIQVYIRVLIDNLLEGIAFRSHCVGRVALWAEQNQLRLNTSKTTAIAFGSPHAMGIFEHLNHQGFILPSGEVIRFENMVKTLGVMVDNTLSWKPQVD